MIALDDRTLSLPLLYINKAVDKDPAAAKAKYENKATHVLVFDAAVDVAACATGSHVLCVLSDGRALAMGSGSKGQLGGGDCEDRDRMTPVKLPKVCGFGT